jgi:hypothetical protein
MVYSGARGELIPIKSEVEYLVALSLYIKLESWRLPAYSMRGVTACQLESVRRTLKNSMPLKRQFGKKQPWCIVLSNKGFFKFFI